MNQPKNAGAERFADNLRALRRRAGFSQEVVAVRARLHRTEVGLLERGKREPRLLTIVKLAAVLDVSLDVLCEGIGWQVVANPTTGALLIDGRLVEQRLTA